MIRKSVLTALVLGWLVPFRAQATDETHSATFGPTQYVLPIGTVDRTDVRSGSVSIPKFDPALGTLTGIQITSVSRASLGVFVEITPRTFPTGINAMMDDRYQVSPPNAPPLNSNTVFNQTVTLPAGQSATIISYGEQIANGGPVLASDFSPYVGPGTISIPISMTFVQEAATSVIGMSLTRRFTPTTQTTVSITYTYDPVECTAFCPCAAGGFLVGDATTSSDDWEVHPLSGPITGTFEFRNDCSASAPARGRVYACKATGDTLRLCLTWVDTGTNPDNSAHWRHVNVNGYTLTTVVGGVDQPGCSSILASSCPEAWGLVGFCDCRGITLLTYRTVTPVLRETWGALKARYRK